MSQRPLSKEQIRQIGIVRSDAFKHQCALGAVTFPSDLVNASKKDKADFWAHQEIAKATQRVCSTREMVDDEYAMVKLHFVALCGPEYRDEVPKALGKVIEGAACDREPGCEYLRDMMQWLAKAGYQIGYAIAISKAKFRGETNFRRLSEWQLKQLHDTVVNRCRAKLGLGDADNRNKRQRGIGAKGTPVKPVSKPQPKLSIPPQPMPAPTERPASQPQKTREYTLKPRPASGGIDPSKMPF